MKNFKSFIAIGIMASGLLFGGVNAEAATHKVKKGDTLWEVSSDYKTTVPKIKNLNNLRSNTIYVGQILKVSGSKSSKQYNKPKKSVVRNTGKYSYSDVDLLARLVRAEAQGESYTGKVAVAAVVLNRVSSGSFPNSIRGVIYQSNQFSPVMNGSINKPADKASKQAANAAINGSDPSLNALFFYNPSVAKGSWLNSRPATTTIGNHRFTK